VKLWLISVSILCGSVAVAWAAKDEPPPIVAFLATEYEVADTGEGEPIAIRIAPAVGVDVGKLTIVVRDAARGDRHDPALLAAFHGAAGTDAAGAKIELAITLAKVSDAASYSVTLEVSGGAPTTPVAPVTQVVKLKHPAAKARAVPALLVIERVGWWPGSGDWPSATLELEELTGRSRLTPRAAVLDLRETRAGHEPIDGAVAFTAPPVVAAGARAPIGVAIADDLPAGKLTGKSELRAPQLEEAVVISYELHSRVSNVTIALALALGLAIGWLAKSVLRARLDLLRVRRELAEVGKAASEYLDSPDAELAGAAAGVIEACRAKLDESAARAAQLGIARDAQQKALDAAVVGYKARLATARQEVAGLCKLVDAPWSIPRELAGMFDAIAVAAAGARAAVERGDAVGASKATKDAGDAPGAAQQAFQAWRDGVASLITKLQTQPAAQAAPWPAAAGVVASEAAAELTKRVDELGDQPAADAAALASWIAKLHAVQRYLAEAATRMATTWGLVIAAARRELASLSPNPLDALGDALPRLGADPRGYLASVVEAAPGVVSEFRTTLLAIAPKDKDKRKEVEALIAAGTWGAAAAAALPPVEDQGRLLGDREAERVIREPGAAPASPDAPLPGAARPVLLTPDTDAVLRAAIRSESIAARATTALSFAILVVLYLAHYAATPIETWAGLFAVFAQALTLDLGVDTVVQALKSLLK